MNIRMDELIRSIATALDMVESELVGASANHGKRIACLTAAMGQYLGLDSAQLSSLTTCALFHDNALTEYILSEREGDKQEHNLRLHCQYGQRNMEDLPLPADIGGFILYHHERADGNGPFGQKEGEYPLGAELIAIADRVDVTRHLQRLSAQELPELHARLAAQAGRRFTARSVQALTQVLDADMLFSLRDEHIHGTAARIIPVWSADMESEAVIRLAGLMARIIDYKSAFTRKHSLQIANKAWLMGGYYGLSPELRARVYLAAAIHDLGKLQTPTGILEKPGRLTDEEFAIIKEHVAYTHTLLKDIAGLEDICEWASNHHEKLDGSGYPRGKTAAELDFVSRLLCCIDIYQAVSEERPYHAARDHGQTMPILYDMAAKGQIDSDIVRDLDTALEEAI